MPLTVDQERALIARAQAGDTEAREELIMRFIGLAKKVAARWSAPDYALEFDDLFHEALVALMGCIDKYDPNRGARFSTYAFRAMQSRVGRVVYKSGTIRRSSNPQAKHTNRAAAAAHAIRQQPVRRLDDDLPSEDETLHDIIPDEADTESELFDRMELTWLLSLVSDSDYRILMDFANGSTMSQASRNAGKARTLCYNILSRLRKRAGIAP